MNALVWILLLLAIVWAIVVLVGHLPLWLLLICLIIIVAWFA